MLYLNVLYEFNPHILIFLPQYFFECFRSNVRKRYSTIDLF